MCPVHLLTCRSVEDVLLLINCIQLLKTHTANSGHPYTTAPAVVVIIIINIILVVSCPQSPFYTAAQLPMLPTFTMTFESFCDSLPHCARMVGPLELQSNRMRL